MESRSLIPGRRRAYLPHAFTDHGTIMAATVLNSPEAVKTSLFVVRAFVKMREQLAANAEILKRLAATDRTLLDHDAALRLLWQKLKPLRTPPPERRVPSSTTAPMRAGKGSPA
jgi:alanine-alpha-ketoisovalerate/valine-pyruvate aminotransferase